MESVANSKQRFHWLDILKGIGIILVVVGHVFDNDFAYKWIYSFHMPLFFFASGWVYRKRDIISDIKSRFFGIMIPFYSFGVLELLYFHLIENRIRNMDVPVSESVLGIVLGYYDYLDFNGHLWFLPCIFLMGVVFNILVNLAGKRVTYAVSVLMAVLFIVFSVPSLIFGIHRILESLIYFSLGTLFADKKADDFIGNKPTTIKVCGIVVAGIISVLLAHLNLTEGVMSVIAAFVGIVLCVIISVTIKNNRLLEQIGQKSLFILCVHGPLCRLFMGVFAKAADTSSEELRQNPVSAFIFIIVTIAICCLAYPVFLKFTPWMVGRKVVKKIKSE